MAYRGEAHPYILSYQKVFKVRAPQTCQPQAHIAGGSGHPVGPGAAQATSSLRRSSGVTLHLFTQVSDCISECEPGPQVIRPGAPAGV